MAPTARAISWKQSPLAKLMQLAEIDPTDSALDVGCGTGYAAAILSRLAQSVVALESDSALAQSAASTLSGAWLRQCDRGPGRTAAGPCGQGAV